MDNRTRKRKIFSIIKLVLLVLIVIGIPAYLFFFHRDFLLKFKDFEGVTRFLESYKNESIIVYIALQVLQIVISVIPGQVFQIAAGYLYGFLPGLVFSLIGATIGTSLTFYIAYFLGRDAVKVFVKDETIEKYIHKLNSKRGYLIVFLLYLIPGLPKDVVSYVAGISTLRFRTFLLLSLAGRLPAMAASILIGRFYRSGHYIAMGTLAGIGVVIFIICFIFRKKIIHLSDVIYEKLAK